MPDSLKATASKLRLVLPEKLGDYGVGLGDRQRRRLEAIGDFPRRVKLSGRSHAYCEHELIEYLARKVAERG